MAGSIVHSTQSSSLADILERVLDKGIVVAGDISISLVGVELLTIKIRLVIASVDKAKEMGLDWWSGAPPTLEAPQPAALDSIGDRLSRIEALLGQGLPPALPIGEPVP